MNVDTFILTTIILIRWVNVAVELGQYGTKQEGLIQERYLKFDLGVSVFERWFIKRRYK